MKIKLPYVALFAVLLLALILTINSSNQTDNRLRVEFSGMAKDLAQAIEHRTQIYSEQLHAGKAFFDSSEYVSRKEWNTFYTGLAIAFRYPGLHAYEFVRYVPHEKKTEFVNTVRKDTSLNPEGYPDFTIWPEGDRDNYYVVDYIEPMKGNEKAFGLDTSFDESRLKAIEASRESGAIMSTSRITLVQETGKQFAFIIYLPVYRPGTPQKTDEERRKSFLGFIAGVFRVGELLDGIVEESHQSFINYAVYDAPLSVAEEESREWGMNHLLYSTDESVDAFPNSLSAMRNTAIISVAGREWTVVATPTEAFLKQSSSLVPLLIFASGAIIAILIFLTLSSFEESRESNERFRRFSESAYEGILIHDRGIVLDVNSALANMFGYESKSLIGKDATSFVAPESLDITVRNMLEGSEEPYEINVVRKDGSICPVELRGKNISYKGAEARVIAVNDLSERKLHEERMNKSLREKEAILEMLQTKNAELIQTLEELQSAQSQLIQAEKMSSLGQLVAGLAHEINTPIGIGVTAASFLNGSTKEIVSSLEQNTMKKSELVDYLSNAQKSSELILANLQRTAELIGSFKMVSADQTRDDVRVFELKSYFEEIIRSLKPALKKTKHTVTVNCPERIEVNLNPGAFGQILTNLVINSIHHGFKGIESGTITISVLRQDGTITVTYHDNGTGIPKKNQSKIFEPFFTTARGEGGTGLGLHIIYNIVHSTLKGKIVCKSAVNEGTTFIISFPENPTEKPSDNRK